MRSQRRSTRRSDDVIDVEVFEIGEPVAKKKKSTKPVKTEIVELPVSTKKKIKKVTKLAEEMLPAEMKPKRQSGKISRTDTDSMDSIIGDSTELIQQLLEAGEADNATSQMYKRMLQTVIDLLPYAEQNIRDSKGQRGVYQLNSMMTQIRELLMDVRSSQDRGQIGEAMVQQVIMPCLLDIGMSVAREYSFLSDDLKHYIPADRQDKALERLRESRARVAAEINQQFEKIKTGAREYLSGG